MAGQGELLRRNCGGFGDSAEAAIGWEKAVCVAVYLLATLCRTRMGSVQRNAVADG